MILQCEQCNTRFRLDDSKLKPGGVKVRCSKCRHVFIAGAEPAHEETDFDALLSGLGAQAEQPAPPPAEAAAAAPSAEPSATAAEAAPSEEEGRAPEAAPSEPADFSFAVPSSPNVEAPSAGAFAGVSEFSFEPEGEESSEAGALPSDFSFDSGGGAKGEPALTEEMAGFNEFSFDDEPSAKELEPPPSGTEVVGFQEFSFDEEAPAPAAIASKEEKGAPQEFDFGEFSFEPEAHEQGVQEVAAAPAAEGSDFDFGDFSFDAEEVEEEKKVREFDLSDFTFEGDADQAARELAQSFEARHEPSEPVFNETAELAGEVAAPESGREGEALGSHPSPAFSFGEDLLGGPTPGIPHREALHEGTEPVRDEQEAAAPAEGQATYLDFDKVFAEPGTPPHYGAVEAEEEELPPLGISSRRRGRPVVTAILVVLCLLLLGALAGAGFYLLKGGPAALERFGLGSVAHWLGLEGAEEGRIVIVSPSAAFYQNREAGELFVVTGQAENQFRKPRASIHVRVSIYDKAGKTLMQKTAYCGNRISQEQLASMPISKLDAAMNNQFGDSLSNLGVKPGEKIPFVVAIANVPKEAADFGVEVIGSTVAGQ